MELLDDRVGSRATLITSQLPVTAWHAWLDEPTLAEALAEAVKLEHVGYKILRTVPTTLPKPNSSL